MREQPIPEAARSDPGAMELARVWVAGQGVHCGLRIGVYDGAPVDEAMAWGVVLADLLRSLGQGLSDHYRRERAEVVQTLLKAMRDELAAPTTRPEAADHPEAPPDPPPGRTTH